MLAPFARSLTYMLALQMMANTNTTKEAVQKPPPSLYKRVLPDSCTAFSSSSGKRIFASALAHNGLKSFYSLIQQFTTQSEPAYCGLTTLVLILNALSVDPLINWKGPWRWYSEELLNCCLPLEEIKTSGITIMDFACLARCQGLQVEMTYAEEDGLSKFRQAVKEACVESSPSSFPSDGLFDRNQQESSINTPSPDEKLDKVLAVSYSRKVLSQTGSGHFSPIAAYDPESDQVLILDTARFKYGAHWTKLELLYDAMKPIDTTSGKSRGYALLSFPDDKFGCCRLSSKSEATAVQPMSLLFSTKLSQSPARKKYKDFLNKLTQNVTLDMVVDYWTQSPDTSVWDILKPLSVPENQDQRESVNALHRLIDDAWENIDGTHEAHYEELIQQESNGKAAKGHTNILHSIFVVFLASLEERSRNAIVRQAQHDKKTHSDLSIEQLLNEASLIATEIETSDQNDTGCPKKRCCKKRRLERWESKATT
ncbi:unnamed protein product [Cylindrotheca closterium]|uniref:glutathione gamma-glutamylcysteinyltransferase n=1 Tax=Cylindrotheca closterium TaxID=2856 RepID=A0AAD2CQP0_9STRA|nr:unnamed protein product [Cylindrotheca closterium]